MWRRVLKTIDRRSAVATVTAVASLFFALCWPPLAPDADARPQEDVERSGYVTIFVYKNFQPYSWEEDGEVVGIDADIARAIAEGLGVELRLLVREADENVDDDLRVNIWKGDLIHRQAADIMLHVPYDRELEIRAESLAVLFNPYFGEEVGVAYDGDVIPSVETFARFVSKPIAVELDTVSDFFLSGAFRGQLHQSIRRGRTFMDAVRLFEEGTVPALMATKAQLQWVAFRNPDRNIQIAKPPMPGIIRDSWPIGMAVKEDSRDLGYAVGDVITSLKENGKLQAIFARYGVDYQEPPLD